MGEDCSARTMAASLTSKLLSDPAVLAAFSNELHSIVGKSSGYIESLPKSVKRRIKALKKLQVELIELESAFHADVHKLECKYTELYGPLHKKRHDIIQAVLEPSDSDCEWVSDEEEEEEQEENSLAESAETNKVDAECKTENAVLENNLIDENAKGIPEFWLTVLKNVTEFSDRIKEYDEKVLKHLKDITISCKSEPDMGFQVGFVFGPNEFFSNEVLTKSFFLRCPPNPNKPLVYDGPEIMRCEGCVIDWKAGKNITEKKMKEKVEGSKGATKFTTKTIQLESFFNFFSTSSESKDDDEDEEELDQLMADFELGQMLQQRIVPRAVLYFTGEALDMNDDEEDEDEDDDDEDDDDDGEDEGANNGDNNADDKAKRNSSDEEDDPDYVPPKNMKEGPPNCNQQ